jgi:hypothetical protein
MLTGRLATLLVFCAWGAASAHAQQYADLYGRILDTSDAGIGDASVTVVNEDSGFRRSTVSDDTGAYSVGSLEPGSYKITVRKDRFRSAVRFNVTLTPAAPSRVDFTLFVGSINDSIVVYGTAPMLDRSDAATGGLFEHDEIERLPVNGGGVLSLLELIPGTTVTPATRGDAGQFTVNGQRPNTNYFTLDGVSANNGVTAGGLPAQSTGGTLPAVSAFGSLDSIISTDAIQDVQVQTSSTIAEFGRLPGASIAFSSQSGANNLHGSTFFRVRNELLNANDWFANQAGINRSPLRLYDITQTLGGPIKRNRTFFFLSYEHLALDQPFVWQQPVPALLAGQAVGAWAVPLLQLFPPANGATFANGIGVWTGRTNAPAALTTGGLRIDQAITSRVSLFGRYNDSPSINNFGSLDVNRLDLREQSLTLGVDVRPTAALSFDFRVNESQSTAHSVWLQNTGQTSPGCPLSSLLTAYPASGATCDSLMQFTIAGVGTLESGREGDRKQRQFQVVQSAAWHRGRHSAEIGADYRSITAVRRDAGGTLSILADQIADVASADLPYVGTTSPINQTVSLPELSLWAEDTWQVSRRLTIAVGLRWEYSPSPFTSGTTWSYDPTVSEFVPIVNPQPVWKTSVRDFAPRLGLAWRLTGNGRTVLRAGGGVYYDSSMSIAADVLNGGPLTIAKYQTTRGIFTSTVLGYGFAPRLRLPEINQGNFSLEHGFGEHDVLSVGYIASAGHGLIRREIGGPGSLPSLLVALTTNDGFSKYHSLQVQYRRRFVHGLELQGSYTWSHSIDNDSSDAFLTWAGAGSDLGNSDFDLRQTLNLSGSYQFTRRDGAHFPGRALGGWSLSTIFRARTGFPITVQQSEEYEAISLINAFRPGYLGGQPLWITDPNSPGGRRLNPDAFLALPPGVQGNLGRNVINGFGMYQLDLAASRDFRLNDRASIQVRGSAFNALNHANFADPVKFLDSPLFGQSTSMLNMMLSTGTPGTGLSPILQTGGPRSLQLSLRLRF